MQNHVIMDHVLKKPRCSNSVMLAQEPIISPGASSFLYSIAKA